MREQGRAEALAGPWRIEWRAGTAEQTGLEASSVGLVLCAQAFHWFRPEAALAEFARILRPGGRVALVWNDRDERDAFTRGYGGLIIAASGENPAAISHTRPEPLFASRLFGCARKLELPNEQVLDEEGLVGRIEPRVTFPTPARNEWRSSVPCARFTGHTRDRMARRRCGTSRACFWRRRCEHSAVDRRRREKGENLGVAIAIALARPAADG